jgi:hypothetical protein
MGLRAKLTSTASSLVTLIKKYFLSLTLHFPRQMHYPIHVIKTLGLTAQKALS